MQQLARLGSLAVRAQHLRPGDVPGHKAGQQGQRRSGEPQLDATREHAGHAICRLQVNPKNCALGPLAPRRPQRWPPNRRNAGQQVRHVRPVDNAPARLRRCGGRCLMADCCRLRWRKICGPSVAHKPRYTSLACWPPRRQATAAEGCFCPSRWPRANRVRTACQTRAGCGPAHTDRPARSGSCRGSGPRRSGSVCPRPGPTRISCPRSGCRVVARPRLPRA